MYNHRDHELYRLVAALRDPLNKNDSGAQGYLKFSCVCMGPGDTQKIHDSVDEDEEAEKVNGGFGVASRTMLS